jgi:DNA repair exonuclease SbcCD ATPase subunit
VIQNKGGNLRSRTFNIVSEEDKNPRVHIESTSKEIKEFGGKENLDIFYKAEDDFGLTKLLLIIKTKKGEQIKPIEQMRDEPKTKANKFAWDFSTVESEPGEAIEAMIYVYDNDILSGPKLGVSNVIKIKLNDPRKKHETALTSVENLLDKLLDTLADEIENHQPAYKNISRTKAVQDEISAKIEKIINSLNKILENIKEDDLSDYTYFLGLSKMKTRIDDLLDKRLDIISSLSGNKLSRLDGLISEEVNEFEDDILFIDSLLKGEKLRESLLYGRETLGRYHELSELLKNLKRNGNEETRKEIEKKIKGLRNLMSQLTQKLASVNVDTPNVHLNPDAFNSLDLQQKLDDIMNLIDQGEIDKALGLLTQVGNNLQQMIASLESGYHSFTYASLSKEIKELNDIISNIKDLEESEKSLNEKTEKIKSSLLKKPSSEGNLNKFVEREKKKLKMLKNLIMKTRASFSSPLDKSEFVENRFLIEKILSGTNELRQRLESFEINEALRQAEDLEEQTIRLRNLSDLQMGSYANASREVQSSSELAGEIKEDLEEFLRGGEKKESIGELARKQGEIEKGTSRLIFKMNDLSEDNFLYSPKIGKKLNESKSFMQGSSNNLHSTEISKAISNQREALMALKQAREEANKLLETYQLSAKGMGMPASFLIGQKEFQDGIHGIDTSYVDIPSAEEFKEGREFKENLLKSLKEGSPEGFSELNKNYYERIIK